MDPYCVKVYDKFTSHWRSSTRVYTRINSSNVSWRKLHEKVDRWLCQVTSYCLLQEHPFEHSFSSCSLRAITWNVIREEWNVWQFSRHVLFVYLVSFGNRVEILWHLFSSCWNKNIQLQQYTVNFKNNLASLQHCCRGFDSQPLCIYRSALQY